MNTIFYGVIYMYQQQYNNIDGDLHRSQLTALKLVYQDH